MTNQLKRKSFVITNCHKRNFRDWIREEFPDLERHSYSDSPPYEALQERFDEVQTAAIRVFDIIFTSSDASLQKYYERDQTALNQAHQRRDVMAYARALDAFIDAIGVE